VKNMFFLLVVLAAASGVVFGESPRHIQPAAQSEETELYGLFLDKWWRGPQIVHIARIAESPTAEEVAEYATCLKGHKLAVLPSPGSPLQLSETSLARRANVRLVDPKNWQLRDPGPAIHSGKSTSKAVSDGFAAGLLTLSRTMFDEEHKVAVFTYSFVCGGLCGGGGGVMFDKTATGWQREMPCDRHDGTAAFHSRSQGERRCHERDDQSRTRGGSADIECRASGLAMAQRGTENSDAEGTPAAREILEARGGGSIDRGLARAHEANRGVCALDGLSSGRDPGARMEPRGSSPQSGLARSRYDQVG
jgi:hypothetical protein